MFHKNSYFPLQFIFHELNILSFNSSCTDEVDLTKSKDFLRKLFLSSEFSPLQFETTYNNFTKNYNEQGEEAFYQICLKWTETAPEHFRKVEVIEQSLENTSLQSKTKLVALISDGAKSAACKEMIRIIDKEGEQESIKIIASFLQSQSNPACKDMAFKILMMKMGSS